MHGIYHDDVTEALLTACRRDYDNDVPRLAYADHLIERGDPYGEYIKLCLDDEDDRRKLRPRGYFTRAEARHTLLRYKHGGNWLGAKWSRPTEARFERGLLVVKGAIWGGSVDGPAQLSAEMVDRMPIVAGVRIHTFQLDHIQRLDHWLGWDHPGLLEIGVPSRILPSHYAKYLREVRTRPPSVSVVRFTHTRSELNSPCHLDEDWLAKFTNVYCSGDAPIREFVRVEVQTQNGAVQVDPVG